jgi:hypothetical protein
MGKVVLDFSRPDYGILVNPAAGSKVNCEQMSSTLSITAKLYLSQRQKIDPQFPMIP